MNIEVNIPSELQEGHASNISGALVAIGKRMVESGTDHVHCSLSNDISLLIVRCILWPLHGTLEQPTIAQQRQDMSIVTV